MNASSACGSRLRGAFFGVVYEHLCHGRRRTPRGGPSDEHRPSIDRRECQSRDGIAADEDTASRGRASPQERSVTPRVKWVFVTPKKAWGRGRVLFRCLDDDVAPLRPVGERLLVAHRRTRRRTTSTSKRLVFTPGAGGSASRAPYRCNQDYPWKRSFCYPSLQATQPTAVREPAKRDTWLVPISYSMSFLRRRFAPDDWNDT